MHVRFPVEIMLQSASESFSVGTQLLGVSLATERLVSVGRKLLQW